MRRLLCKFGLHGPYGGVTRRSWPFSRWWCLRCGATWEETYDFLSPGQRRRRDLRFGEAHRLTEEISRCEQPTWDEQDEAWLRAVAPAPEAEQGKFEGHAERECGEHRTLGSRAWCYECTEYCYPSSPCRGCELPALRAALAHERRIVQSLRSREALWGAEVELERQRREEAERKRDAAIRFLNDERASASGRWAEQRTRAEQAEARIEELEGVLRDA